MPNLPLILYRACLNPWDNWSIPFYKVMPLNQLIVYICDSIIISSNLFLYRFLKQHTTNNSALTASDRRKERKKNFVPAQVGIIATIILFVFTTIQAFFIYKATRFSIKL